MGPRRGLLSWGLKAAEKRRTNDVKWEVVFLNCHVRMIIL